MGMTVYFQVQLPVCYAKHRRRTGLLLITSLIVLTASSQSFSLSLKKVPLEKAFRAIEARVEQRFVYTREMMDQSHAVSIDVKNVSLQKALQLIFENQPLDFSVDEQFIKVRFKPAPVTAAPTDFIIRGKVLDENGAVLAGASVSVKGKAISTATDGDGNFSLKGVNDNDILVISYVGYTKEEITVMGRLNFIVVLIPSIAPLDQTIIIAYGTTTNRLNTGNVTKISSEEISKQPVSNPLLALEGRVPGMTVTQRSGMPGASVQVQIRGRTALDLSLTDDQPLFVIDGVPYAPNNGYLNTLKSALGLPSNSTGVVTPGGLSPFSSINPADIESIEVLKDADATAIYGSRGANGVVLITTKKGKAGKTVFNLTMQRGFSEITKKVDMLSLRQYLDMRHEAFSNDGVLPTASNAYDFLVWDSTRYTNFQKLLIGARAHVNDVQGSVSGGNAGTQFLIGGSYHSESTVFPGDLKDIRESLHFSLNHRTPNQKLGIQFSGSYATDKNNLSVSDLTSFINLPPNLRIYDSVGNPAWNEGGISSYDNPLAYLHQRYEARTDNLLGNLQLNYKLNRLVSLRLNTGYNSVLLDETKTIPLSAQNPMQSPVRASTFATSLFKSFIVEPQAELVKTVFKGKLDMLAGGSYQNQINEVLSVNGSGYIDDALLGSLSGATSISGSKSFSEYRYEAVFGRVNYNWGSKYIVNVSGRRDGSSRFGPGKQFANFGSAGAAWIFSNEKWFSKQLSFISYGKARGSYGVTGNDKIPNYQYLDTWNATDNSYQNGSGLAPAKLFNPDYHWEKTTKLETAIDLGFLKDRILLTAVYYRNRSTNQLVQYKLPTTTGFKSIIMNLPAVVQNSGLEFSVASMNVVTKSFKWNSSANVSIPKNELVSFPGLSSSSYATQYVAGQSLNVLYLYRFLGVDPTTGVYSVEDVNKDGVLNTADYQVSGSLDPKFYGGLQNSLSYKGFQFDFFFQFVRQRGINYLGNSGYAAGMIYNQPTDALNRWKGGGDDSPVQKFTQATNSAAYAAYSLLLRSSGIYGDASFIRLKNVLLAYNLPEVLLKKAGFSGCRISFSGQNLLTLTNYKGGDPETQNYLRLPPMRTIAGTIQFTF